LGRLFLAHGLDVVATDPAPGMEEKLRHYVEAAWPALTKIGLAPGASTSRLRFESDLHEALAGAQMGQENAPEREPLKIKLSANMDSVLPPPAIFVSSTSGIPMSRIQSECKHPERCVTGHPFNPPHRVPLVEVVGGAKTSAETIERAMLFYAQPEFEPALHRPQNRRSDEHRPDTVTQTRGFHTGNLSAANLPSDTQM
jgi:carnitine 3-dehydrogenase